MHRFNHRRQNIRLDIADEKSKMWRFNSDTDPVMQKSYAAYSAHQSLYEVHQFGLHVNAGG